MAVVDLDGKVLANRDVSNRIEQLGLSVIVACRRARRWHSRPQRQTVASARLKNDEGRIIRIR